MEHADTSIKRFSCSSAGRAGRVPLTCCALFDDADMDYFAVLHTGVQPPLPQRVLAEVGRYLLPGVPLLHPAAHAHLALQHLLHHGRLPICPDVLSTWFSLYSHFLNFTFDCRTVSCHENTGANGHLLICRAGLMNTWMDGPHAHADGPVDLPHLWPCGVRPLPRGPCNRSLEGLTPLLRAGTGNAEGEKTELGVYGGSRGS